jgi:hypothetical protein
LWAVLPTYRHLPVKERNRKLIEKFKIPFLDNCIQWECFMSTGDIVEDEKEAKQRILEGKAYQIFLKEEEAKKYTYQNHRIKEILKTLKSKPDFIDT